MVLSDPIGLEYHFLLWGDLIYGSKAELQALGIAGGMRFPGEPGGPKRRMSCRDPRGFPCRVDLHSADKGIYSCSIPFPDREGHPPPLPAIEVAPGVVRHTDCHWFDEFVGTAAALVAAGLLAPDQFPGMPGMRKTIVTILPDGSVFAGAPTANKPAATRAAGAKMVRKGPGRKYRVWVVLSEAEESARLQAAQARRADHDAKLYAMPRPRPLVLVVPSRQAAALERRRQLRLAWSRPAPTFSLPS